jgi:AraC-like DNA-binding protein
MAQVRAAALTNYLKVAEALGLDADAVLARAGLTRAMLAEPDRRIPGPALSLLLEESARESGCEAFGLLMAESRPVAGLGALSLLFRHQRTLRDAIRVLIRYQHVLADTLAIRLEEDAGVALIRVDLVTEHRMTRQPIEMTVGEMRRTLAAITGGAWQPESVHFVHSAPAEPGNHRRVLACAIEFGSAFNGFTCTSASLDAAIAGAEPEIARYALDSVERLAPAGEAGTIVQRTRRALYLLLPSGRGKLEEAAADLELHPRALQRLLGGQATSFGKVLNEVRRELAVRHLASPSLSIEAVAVLVGYATLSSFSRWFAGEFGVAAGVWRAGQPGRAACRPGPP